MSTVKCWKRGEGRRTRNYGYFPKHSGDIVRFLDGSVMHVRRDGWRRVGKNGYSVVK